MSEDSGRWTGATRACASCGRASSTSTRRRRPGMTRAAAIDHAKAGAQQTLGRDGAAWRRTPRPARITTAHLESIIYVVKGRARMRWGERLEFMAEAEPGDFIFVPPYVPHQEINALAGDAARMRGGAQRPGGGGRQPRHRAGRGGRGGALGRSEPSGDAGVTRLEIISDPVCPWCYLGAANLMRALGGRGGASVRDALAAVPARPAICRPRGWTGPRIWREVRRPGRSRTSHARLGRRWGAEVGIDFRSTGSGGRRTRSTRTG